MKYRSMIAAAALGLGVWAALSAAPVLRADEKPAATQPAKNEYRLLGVIAGLSPVDIATMSMRLSGDVWLATCDDPSVGNTLSYKYLKKHRDLFHVRPLDAPGTLAVEMKRAPEVSDADARIIGKTLLATYLYRLQNDRDLSSIEERRVFVKERDDAVATMREVRYHINAYKAENQLTPEPPAPAMREALDKARLSLMQAKARYEALAAKTEEAEKVAVNKPAPAITAAILGQPVPPPKNEQEAAVIIKAVEVAVARADLEVQAADALVRLLAPEADKERKAAIEDLNKRQELKRIEDDLKYTEQKRDTIEGRLYDIRINNLLPGPQWIVVSPDNVP